MSTVVVLLIHQRQLSATSGTTGVCYTADFMQHKVTHIRRGTQPPHHPPHTNAPIQHLLHSAAYNLQQPVVTHSHTQTNTGAQPVSPSSTPVRK